MPVKLAAENTLERTKHRREVVSFNASGKQNSDKQINNQNK
jgi:hypothetical protein